MARYELSPSETAAVAGLTDRFLATCNGWDPLGLIDRITDEAQRLPEGLRRFLVGCRAAEEPVIAVANLPVADDLVPTPPDWEIASKEEAGVREELVLLLLAAVLGDPFSWTNQQHGRLVHDVCPAKGQESSLTSASSQTRLDLHTEDVFHPCRGDYVALLCLRNPDRVATTIAGLDTGSLPDWLFDALCQNRFRFFPDDSHSIATGGDGEPVPLEERVHELASVLFGPPVAPYLRIDAEFTRAVPGDHLAERAVRHLADLLRESAERIVLLPGDAVFLDNYRVVHGRDVFTPRYDGTDRWLKRTNLVRDLRRVYVHNRSRARVVG